MARQSRVGIDENQGQNAESVVILSQKKAKIKRVRIPPEFEEISLMWVKDAPFFGEFMFRFHYYETDSIPTMAVNSTKGNINFYYNPEFLHGGGMKPKIGKDGKPIIIFDDQGNPTYDENGQVQIEMEPREALTKQEIESVLVHEIMHLIRLHHERSLEDHYIFNIAADMLINNDILTLKIGRRDMKLPEGGVYLDMAKKEGYDGAEVSEPLYNWLLDKREEYAQKYGQSGDLAQDGNQQGQGSGSGDQEDQNGQGQGGKQTGPGGDSVFDTIFGSKIDEHDVMDESDEMAKQAIEDAIENAKVRSWGNMSGSAVDRLRELIKPAKLPWKVLLRRFLSSFVYDHGPHVENTWSRRNRRGYPLPGSRKLNNRIVIAVDTSGSISNDELNSFFAEIEKIVKDTGQIIMVQCDTQIVDVHNNYKRGDYKKIQIRGRGGTIVQPVFDWMKENGYQKFPVVYFTDGWFSYDFNTYGINTLWIVTDGNIHDIPHGKNVNLET